MSLFPRHLCLVAALGALVPLSLHAQTDDSGSAPDPAVTVLSLDEANGMTVSTGVSGTEAITSPVFLGEDYTGGTLIGSNSGWTDGGSNLTMTGSGTVILTDANTYSGTTVVSGGQLQLAGSSTDGSVSDGSAGATLGGSGVTTQPVLVVGPNDTIAPGDDGAASGNSGVGTLTLTGGSSDASTGVTLGFQLNGTGIDSGSYSGGANFDTITINTAGLNSYGTTAGLNTLAPGGTTTVPGYTTDDDGATLTVATGSIGVLQYASGFFGGTLSLSGGTLEPVNSGFSYPITMGAGADGGPTTLIINGTSLNVTGSLTQNSSNTLLMVLAGQLSGNAQMNVTGDATISGMLQVKLASNFISQMSATDTFTVMNVSGTLNGQFSNVADGSRIKTLDGLGSFQVNYTANTVVLSNFVAANSTVTMNGADIVVGFQSVNGRTYAIQSSTDLQTWTTVQDSIVGDGANIVVTIPNGWQGGQSFYRVSTEVPSAD